MSLDSILLTLAAEAATSSPDTSKKVGCVITDRDGRIIVTGFNALPDGCFTTPEKLCRPEKYKWTEHAERRALNHAARHGIAVDGGSVHVTYFPCHECARSMVDSGIRRVVSPLPDCTHATWGESWRTAIRIFQEAAVELTFMEVPDVSE